MAQARSSKNRKMDSGCAQGIVTVIRALLSVLLLILAYSINASTFAAILMIAVSAILSGFDIALAAIENILKNETISTISYLSAYALLRAFASDATSKLL